MNHTHYHDSNGLSSENVSTAQDLVHLVNAVYKVPLIRDFSTHVEKTVKPGRRSMHFVSSNRLVRASNDWRIGLQKTGYTRSEEHMSELQSLMRTSYAVVCLKKKPQLTRKEQHEKTQTHTQHTHKQHYK